MISELLTYLQICLLSNLTACSSYSGCTESLCSFTESSRTFFLDTFELPVTPTQSLLRSFIKVNLLIAVHNIIKLTDIFFMEERKWAGFEVSK